MRPVVIESGPRKPFSVLLKDMLGEAITPQLFARVRWLVQTEQAEAIMRGEMLENERMPFWVVQKGTHASRLDIVGEPELREWISDEDRTDMPTMKDREGAYLMPIDDVIYIAKRMGWIVR